MNRDELKTRGKAEPTARPCWLGICLAVGLMAGTAWCDDQPLSELVGKLDSPRYEERARATEQLIARGRPSIEPLLGAFKDGSLELRIRVVHILRQLALDSDAATEDAATRALTQLSRSSQSVAWRADEVLKRLGLIREDRAIKRLKALGAEVGRLTEPNYSSQPALVIDSADWKGSEEDLRQLARIKSITTVKLVGPKVTDQWLRYVAQMPQLTGIVLSETEHVTANGISHLAALRQLAELDIFYAPLDDTLIEAVKPLLDQIRVIKLYGTQVTADGALRLQKQLPVQAELDYRRGAFLGVRCSPESLCVVESVVEGSAAFRAGIRSGDILIRFDDKPVRTFDDLKASIAKYRPGDKAKIALLRGFGEVSFFFGSPVTTDSLGIAVERHPIGLRITDITSGKRGARVAMRKGDIIYSVGGITPESLEQLVKTLEKNNNPNAPLVPQRQLPGLPGPGMRAPFRVVNPQEVLAIRGAKQREVEVSFGRWDR